MTIEQLEKANKIHEEIKEKKEFLEAFNSPLSNSIRACSHGGPKVLLLDNDKNISDLIRGYVSDQIAELEKQLEEM